MKQIILSALCITTLAFADVPANIESAATASQIVSEATAPANTSDDNIYVIQEIGRASCRERVCLYV